jgi:hypothetical protein
MTFFDDVLFYGATQVAIAKKAERPSAELLYLACILQERLPIVDRMLGRGHDSVSARGNFKAPGEKARRGQLECSHEEIASGKREEIRNELKKLLP